jgi:hypothetical protein
VSDEEVQPTRSLSDVRVIMDLERLGELIACVALRLTQLRGIEPPNFDGDEMRDLAITGWRQVEFMADREDFKQSIFSDLENLDKVPADAPAHRPEFGFFEPPV